MHYNMEECGHRIRHLRETHGYTQGELAALISTDRTLLSKVESGTRNFPIETYVKLAELFGVTLDQMLLSGKPGQDQLKKDVLELAAALTKFAEML